MSSGHPLIVDGKETDAQPPLHVNALEYSPKGSRLVVGGPDGYCMVLPVDGGAGVEMKGHVGDVLDVKWFPSGEVCFSSTFPLPVM